MKIPEDADLMKEYNITHVFPILLRGTAGHIWRVFR